MKNLTRGATRTFHTRVLQQVSDGFRARLKSESDPGINAILWLLVSDSCQSGMS